MNKGYKLQAEPAASELNIDKLIRSRRKTVGIEITDKLELIVRAPQHLPFSEIKDIVKRKSKWINKTREKLRFRSQIVNEKTYKIGDTFYFKGKPIKLSSIETGNNNIELRGNKITLYKSPMANKSEKIKGIFIRWYKRQARDFINKRVEIYSKLTGLYPSSVKITSANKRWGSCSGKDRINFSYRLIMAPPAIIDYVVVHELIHIEEKNHSRRFWEKVEAVIPDYRERRKWLKKNGFLMSL